MSVILENVFHKFKIFSVFYAEYDDCLLFLQITVYYYNIFQKKSQNSHFDVEATNKCLSLSVNQLLPFAVQKLKWNGAQLETFNFILPRLLQLKFSHKALYSRMHSYCQNLVKLLQMVHFWV